jgi:hypothetical protein
MLVLQFRTDLPDMAGNHFVRIAADRLEGQFQLHRYHFARRINHQHIGPMLEFLGER